MGFSFESPQPFTSKLTHYQSFVEPGPGSRAGVILSVAILSNHPGETFLSSDSQLQLAVVGAGAFGKNHARVYHKLSLEDSSVRLVAVIDSDAARAAAIAAEFGARAFTSVTEALAAGTIHAASVAVPTVHHFAVARELMQAGVDVLIEKPLASTVAEADEIAAIAQQHSCIVQVGHLERFNPAVRATAPLITKPMFFEVHRLSIFTPRSLDVDVVLDLMIHDLDVVLSLVKSPVREVRAVGLPILSEKVDIANVRLEFESGCIANLTASRVSTERVRKLRFFQPHQYISLDYGRQDVLAFTVESDATASVMSQLLGGSEPTPNPQIRMSRPSIESEEPLLAEIKAFLRSVRERSTPVVPLEDGRRALALALQVLESIAEHSKRAGLTKLMAD